MSSKEELDRCLAMDKTLTLRDKRLRLASTRRNCRLVVSNLHATVTASQLATVFRMYGELHEEDTKVGASTLALGLGEDTAGERGFCGWVFRCSQDVMFAYCLLDRRYFCEERRCTVRGLSPSE